MRRFLLALFMVGVWLVSGAAHARDPACVFEYGKTPWAYAIANDRYALVWYCAKPYSWSYEALSGQFSSDVAHYQADLQSALTSSTAFMAAYQKNTQAETDRTLLDLIASTAAAHWPADPVWIVAPSRFVTRPTYPTTAGVRSKTPNGRVITSLTCSCKTLAIVEGTATYCSVAGMANTGTASVLPANTVSLCARQ